MNRRAPFRFTLLCHQRSGSNALGAILNADPSVGLYGQLFNPFRGYRKRHREQLGMAPYTPHPEAIRHFGVRPPLKPRLGLATLALAKKESSLERFMAEFWRNWPGREPEGQDWRALGFKLHDYQVSDSDLAALATRHLDGTVLLWRRNRLRAAVSWAYAVKTDVWTRSRASTDAQPVFELDPGEIEWFMDKTDREVEGWRRVLADSGAHWIELTYEDHVVERDLGGLYEFLGLPYDGPPEFSTKKLAGARYAHVANAPELEERFGSDERGRLFA